MLFNSALVWFQSTLRRWHPRRWHPPQLLSRQIEWIRWLVPLSALLLVLAHQTIEQLWFPDDAEFHFAIDTLIYGLFGPIIIWTALDWIKHRVALKEHAEVELVQTHADLTSLNRRMSFLLSVNQRLAHVTDEDALAALALQLPGEATPAVVSCAMIRFDEHHQPMPVEYHGTLDEGMLASWHQHLSSQPVRDRCRSCQVHTAHVGQNCPMLQQLPVNNVGSVICKSLKRNNREFGILGIFLTLDLTLTAEEQQLIDTLVEEITTAFENIRLRTRELTALYDINETLQLRLDLQGLMGRLLELTVEAGNADAGLLLLRQADQKLTPYSSIGDWDDVGRLPLIESLAEGALRESAQHREPVVATLRGQSANTVVSVLCAPMIADDGPIGVIVLVSRQPEATLSRQTRLVAAIAGQAALLAQNSRLYAQLENQAILNERGRLAREMHDGLAQTLGYLKMRSRQIGRWVDAGQSDKASAALQELAKITDDAYIDLRAALDGLRLNSDDQINIDLCARLKRVVAEFEHQSEQTVNVSLDPLAGSSLSMPAQAHLLRIVQESLNNIRKHADATQVKLTLSQAGDQVRLVMEDNGKGFDAAHDQPNNHHGLRFMQERAELLGAELQVTSAPGKGTRVCADWRVKTVATNG